ncbi:hypothetical protein ACDY96_30755 [Rhizobium mongolense]|uniref:hypothetical protein n=1 Tax=Rhizobium mongolense TaxID=57676 RepID=UPI003557CB07
MKPLIGRRLGLRDGGETRYEGGFDEPIERIVRFWDTPDCILSQADLALRERLPVDNEGRPGTRPELTLKLRMADLFVVATTELPGSQEDAATMLEEDIAPLEIEDPQPDKRSIVMPAKPSIRSRFSLSTTQTADWGASLHTLAGLHLLFPTASELLKVSCTPSSPMENWSAAQKFANSSSRAHA